MGIDTTTAAPHQLASAGLALMVESGEKMSKILDQLGAEYAEDLAARPAKDRIRTDIDYGGAAISVAEKLDPFGDHPDEVARYLSGDFTGTPEGMTGLESPAGVIP